MMQGSIFGYTHICPGCGEEVYNPVKKGHRKKIYCSNACKQKYYREEAKHAYTPRLENIFLGQEITFLKLENEYLKSRIADLESSIAALERSDSQARLTWYKEQNACLEGEVARLTTLLEKASRKNGPDR